ncbi:hypothetical protein AM571_PB00246 (plasmid) [Rhizobium etli 8C-3]|uniref:Uncharacterized protein n=1 Tax=Rhizobium etli 8C-3 TaxID=538025 RepID=A0A1L5PBG7_RHIET|nr:hypothetical protein AM571_PB00246 [Rhizobium etli 8C-3]
MRCASCWRASTCKMARWRSTVFISVSDREWIRTVYRLDGAEKAFRYMQGARRRKGSNRNLPAGR